MLSRVIKAEVLGGRTRDRVRSVVMDGVKKYLAVGSVGVREASMFIRDKQDWRVFVDG